MNIQTLLFILAAICFGLAAARVNAPVNFEAAAFCLITIALWLV